MADSSGEIVEAYDYDPYGNTLIFSAAGTESNWWADDATQANYSACEVLFCGYRYDPESKTYQVRNRQYHPALGRWLQRDPIGFDGGDWNLYGYVANNPIGRVDPSGEWYWVLLLVAGALVWVLLSGGCDNRPTSPPPPTPPNLPEPPEECQAINKPVNLQTCLNRLQHDCELEQSMNGSLTTCCSLARQAVEQDLLTRPEIDPGYGAPVDSNEMGEWAWARYDVHTRQSCR